MDSGSAASASASTSPAASRHGSFSSSNSGGGMTDDGSNGHGPPVEHTSYTPKNILVTGGAGFM